MRALARIRAEREDDGRTRLVELRSSAPLLLRPTPSAVYLVGGAAGPVGGDDLVLQVEVGAGASLSVRSAAATLLHPGTGSSCLRLEVTLGAGASLDWRPEPTVALSGCDHRAPTTLELAVDAVLWWEEDLVLGRHGERPGHLWSRLDVERAKRPLLRHELEVGPRVPGWAGRGAWAGVRRVRSTLTVGPERAERPSGERLHAGEDAHLWIDVTVEGP